MGDINGIGQCIRRLRETDGMTETDMAGHLGMSVSELERMESGMVMPTTTELDAVADLFCLSVDDILAGRTQVTGIRAEHQVDMEIRSDINRILRNLREMQDLMDGNDACDTDAKKQGEHGNVRI